MSGAQALAIARNIARDVNLIVTEQTDTRRDGTRRPCYVVYRRATPANVRIGKRASPSAVLALVKRISGV